MTNDVMRDSIEWAFSIFSQIWPFVSILFILPFSLSMARVICSCGRRRESAVEKTVIHTREPVSKSYVVTGCADCPCLLKGSRCKLRDTGFCFIGQSVKKEENKYADS